MAIEIVERPAFVVVGMSIMTLPKSPDIPELWQKFVPHMDEIPGRTEPDVTYGFMQHQSSDALFYMSAVAVAPPGRAPAGMEIRNVPGGAYARFHYPLSRLGEGFNEIFGHLLPSSGHAQGDGPMLERYGESFCPDDANSIVEILIPLKGRGAS
jgi:AraC family transcriptional regulator